MTTIRNFFSPTKTQLAMTPSAPSPVKSDRKSNAANKPDNKLIVSNMKSVIDSVQKLQKKHKKRKRNANETPEIHDISNILQSNLSFISPNRTEPEPHTKQTPKGTFCERKVMNSIERFTYFRIVCQHNSGTTCRMFFCCCSGQFKGKQFNQRKCDDIVIAIC